jgi:hypothetical protein
VQEFHGVKENNDVMFAQKEIMGKTNIVYFKFQVFIFSNETFLRFFCSIFSLQVGHASHIKLDLFFCYSRSSPSLQKIA